MRPAGEIRQALRAAVPNQAPGVTGASYLDMAQRLAGMAGLNPAAPAELRLVRQTVKNMVQAGELVKVGRTKRLGLYAAVAAHQARSGWDATALQAAWWGRAA